MTMADPSALLPATLFTEQRADRDAPIAALAAGALLRFISPRRVTGKHPLCPYNGCQHQRQTFGERGLREMNFLPARITLSSRHEP
jgi:hypothetical protein